MKLEKIFLNKFIQFLSVFGVLTIVICNFPAQSSAQTEQGERYQTMTSQPVDQNQQGQPDKTAENNQPTSNKNDTEDQDAKKADTDHPKTSNLKKGSGSRSFKGQPVAKYEKTIVPSEGMTIPGSFALKFIPGKTTVETFGQGWTAVASNEVGFVGASHADQKGKIGVLYKNVGTYDGQIINLRIIVNDWSQFSTKNGLIKYRTNTIGTSTQKFNWVDQTWKLEYQNGEKAQLSSTFMTWYDIDQLQYITFDQQAINKITHIYVLKDNEIQYSNEDPFGTTFFASSAKDTDDDDKLAMFTTLFDNVSEVRFKWGKDYSNISPDADLGNGEFLGFTAKKIARTEPDAPTKKVTDTDEINQEFNSLFNFNEPFKYSIYQTVPDEYPEYYYNDFTIDDQINPNLKVKQVKVYDDSEQDITEDFNIDNENNHYTVSAKKDFLASPGFYYNSYRIEFTVQIDLSKPQTAIRENFYSYTNAATAKITSENKTFVKNSNEVNTTVEQRDLPFLKVWEDFNDLFNTRPKSITATLYQSTKDENNQEVQPPTPIASQKVFPGKDKNDPWLGEFKNLDVQDNHGYFYTYEIKDNVTGYTSKFDDGILTNKLNSQLTITGKKIWHDNNNRYDERSNFVMVHLYRQTAANEEREWVNAQEVNQDNNWTYEFKDVEKYDSNGRQYLYSIDEEEVPTNYQKQIEGFDIINTYIGTKTIRGQKLWQDNHDANKARPSEVTVHLLANGTIKATKKVTAATGWKYEFDNLPLLDNGNEIIYTIAEDSVADYSTEIKGFDVINTYSPNKTSLTVTKNWQDNSNQDNLRPSNVTVQLLADNQKQGEPITLNDNNQWTHTWQNLAVSTHGQKIQYSVKEVTVPAGYTSQVNDTNSGNVIITNSHTPATITLTVAKIWNDDNNKDRKRPNKITVQLFQNDQKVTEPIELNQENLWIYRWEKIPEYLNGKLVEYTVKESDVPVGYRSSTSSTNGKTFIITNTYQNSNNDASNTLPLPPTDDGNFPPINPIIPTWPTVTPIQPEQSAKEKVPTPEPKQKEQEDHLPNTGRVIEISIVLIGFLLLLIACCLYVFKFNKRK